VTNDRKWWLAGMLSFLVPGLGQVYNGQLTKGLLFYFLISTWGGLTFSFTYYILKSSLTGFGLGILFLSALIYLAAYLLIIFESIRTAGETSEDHVVKPYNRWYVYLLVILVVSGISESYSSAYRDSLLKAYKIPSKSMQPALEVGDYLICNQLYYHYNDPDRGDLIIFKYPKDDDVDYIKRIVAIPGDTVMTRGNKLFIDGRKTEEPYAMYKQENLEPGDFVPDFGPFTVEDGEYFVMGDNRNNSEDSRFFGAVKRHKIQGKAIFIYFSWDSDIPFRNFIGRLFSIRFSRIGQII
jgi:signal peptidase I